MSLKLDAAMFHGSFAPGDLKADTAQSVFFARQLEEIDSQMYDVKYAALEAFELLPTKKLHPGKNEYTYRQFDGRGIAVMTANYASGSPRADVSGLEFTSKVRSIRNSYGYNVQEIRAAESEGMPLENMRAVQARRAMNEKINRTALLGDAEHAIVGLFNQTNTQTFTVPANGDSNGGSSSKKWTHKTADQIADDLLGIIDQVPTNTSEVEKVTRMLLPYSTLRFIGRKRMGVGDGMLTVLAFVKEQRPLVEFRGALFLDTAGGLSATSTQTAARVVGYDPRPENLELLLPVPFESFPPEREGLEWVVENHARMGGVVLRYPLTMIYADGM